MIAVGVVRLTVLSFSETGVLMSCSETAAEKDPYTFTSDDQMTPVKNRKSLYAR